METTTSLKTFEVTIPEKYADILKKFITSLEGKVKAQKKSGLDEALEDVKAGRIHKYENFEAFKQKMLELLLIPYIPLPNSNVTSSGARSGTWI